MATCDITINTDCLEFTDTNLDTYSLNHFQDFIMTVYPDYAESVYAHQEIKNKDFWDYHGSISLTPSAFFQMTYVQFKSSTLKSVGPYNPLFKTKYDFEGSGFFHFKDMAQLWQINTTDDY